MREVCANLVRAPGHKLHLEQGGFRLLAEHAVARDDLLRAGAWPVVDKNARGGFILFENGKNAFPTR